MKAIGYVRVSSERQADPCRTSLADQRAAIEAKAESLGASVIQWHADEGISGATAEGRPAFMALLHYCEANPQPARNPGVVIVLNDSRMGRFQNPEEAAYWRHHLYRFGWIVRFVEGDAEGTVAPIMRSIHSVQSSEYRRALQANTRRGHHGAARQGFWTRREPYGYLRMVVYPPCAERVLNPGQHKTDLEKVRLTPHPEEAPIVRWIFARYASGTTSMQAIAEELDARLPGQFWACSKVAKILKNPVYRGALSFGNRPSVNMLDAPPPAFIEENAHEAIVSADLWDAVQFRIATGNVKPRRATAFYTFTGLVTCTVCGAPYVGGGHGPHRNSDRVTYFYRDAGGKRGTCPGKMGVVAQALLERAVVEQMSEVFRSASARRLITRAVDRAMTGGIESAGQSEAAIRNARRKQEQRQQRIIALVVDGMISKEEAAPQMEEVRKKLAELDDQLQQARFGGQRARASSTERDAIIADALSFADQAQNADGPVLRQLIEPWIGYLTFDKHARSLAIGVRTVPAFGRSIGPLVGTSGTVGHPRLIERSVVLGRRSA